MFGKILIANRGEIACRIIRTARRMGIKTIAVYSEADEGALHVRMADEARLIGPPPAGESYLDIKRVIAAAKASGAEAIHPGYGFLSENADFARACVKAGIVFIGPQPETIEALGDKAGAKALMAKAGVPLVPGYHGGKQDAAFLAKEAQRIGLPVLIKATAGGGGRGMRVVERGEDFVVALEGAKREAESSFGDGRVILEKYLRDPRHVEVQVFGDSHGNVVHLFARDCSLQRRHQKVIEEAPPPGLPAEMLEKLHDAALTAGRAVGYRGAGTVEFIVAAGDFHFIEANTRLQVEHPVTEMITGLDLVEWQLRIAAGEELPLHQADIRLNGHAFEARLYAEDPARDFMPSAGHLARLHFPTGGEDLRIETGLRPGDTVSEFYDPMIAKLVVWGKDRATARNRMGAALSELRVLGIATNRDFLLRLVAHRSFAKPLDTGFIARNLKTLADPGPAPEAALAAVALSRIVAAAPVRVDGFSPWRLKDGWRGSGDNTQEFRFDDHGTERRFQLHFTRDGLAFDFGKKRIPAMAWAMPEGDLAFELGNRHFLASVVWRDGSALAALPEGAWRLRPVEDQAKGSGASSAGRVLAPMPGKIVAVSVKQGEAVKRGQVLAVLEAMKMEHAIAAAADGVITAIHCAPGQPVGEGVELLVIGSKP